MGRTCAVIDCLAASDDSLHGIPKDGKTKELFLEFLRVANKDYSWKEVPNLYVCSKHFTLDHITFGKQGKRCIAKDGFPTLIDGICITNEFRVNLTNMEDNKEPIKITEHDSDIDHLKTQLATANNQLSEARLKIKILQQKLHRRESTLNNMKEKKSIKLDIEFLLEQLSSYIDNKLVLDIVRRMAYKTKTQFTDTIKDFAFSQNYYSNKAYEHLRKNFNTSTNVLPSVRQFGNWTKHVNSSPGFLPLSLSFLQNLSSQSSTKLYYNILLDEIHIRKQVIHEGSGFVGYTNYGGIVENDKEGEIATTALFIMASSINGTYRVPLGYILTNGLKTVLLANVIIKTLEVMNETNSIVVAVTFDGLRSNLSAVQSLGANLDTISDEFKPTIKDPNTNREVSVILDACHMIKLMRNLFKHYSVIFNGNGERIYWWYIQKLHETQELAGLKSAPKIGSRHVQFELQKMKTKLALQVMSNSVAVSLAVCRDLKIPGFENSEATQEFLEIMNRLFDLLNSRSGQCGNKAPLDPSKKDYYHSLFTSTKKYLLSLSVMEDNERVLLVHSKRATAVRGLITTITSIENIMTNFVENPDEDLRCLSTYKLSQDKLELFFSLLRSRNGSNNNPNVVQLRSSLKKILCMQADSVTTGNCQDQEETLDRICPFKNITSIMDNEESCTIYEDNFEDEEFVLPSELQDFVDNVVAYIAGAVGSKIGPKLQCSMCICKLFPSDEDVEKIQKDCILLLHRDNGGLFLPSFFLISICKLTEKHIRQFEARGISSMSKDEVLNAVMKDTNELCDFQTDEAHTCHDEMDCNLNHGESLVRTISSEYIKIRFHHTAKQRSLKLNPTTNRSACTKKYLFDGQ